MVIEKALVGAVTFPGKEPSEAYRFHFRQHWLRLLPTLLKAGIWTILVIFMALTRNWGFELDDTVRRLFLMAITIFFVFFQMLLMRRWYEYFLFIVIVTNAKLHYIKKPFIFMDHQRSVELVTIKDIRRDQRGLIQPMLGFGTLLLDTAQGEMSIHFVPKISQMHSAIIERREESTVQQAQKSEEKLRETVKQALS